MRAIILLLAIFFLTPKAKSQDFCRQVVKDTSKDKATFNFASPYDPLSRAPMRITRSYTTDEEYPFDNFNIIFQIFGDLESIYNIAPNGDKDEKTEKKVVIEFADHSSIVDDSMTIIHDFSLDKTEAIRYVFYPVTKENYKDFMSKKIVKFSLAGYETTVPNDSTNAFQKYLECIRNVRP